jgi:hypothetical protein
MTENVIDLESRRRSPKQHLTEQQREEAIAEARRLERERLDAADAVRQRLEGLKKVPAEDAPRMAKNLGEMLDTRFAGQRDKVLREIVEQVWPKAEAKNIMSKRRRFVRWPEEEAEARRSSQDYDIKPAKYLAVSDGIAELSRDHSLPEIDRQRDCLRRLVAGTSFDSDEHHTRRLADSAAQEVMAALDAMLRRIQRSVDLRAYFDAFYGNVFTECSESGDGARAPFQRVSSAVQEFLPWFAQAPFSKDMWSEHENMVRDRRFENIDFKFAPSISLGNICLPFLPACKPLRLTISDEGAVAAALDRGDVDALSKFVQDEFVSEHREDANYLLKQGEEADIRKIWPSRQLRKSEEMVTAWKRCLIRGGELECHKLVERKQLNLVVIRDIYSKSIRIALHLPEREEYDTRDLIGWRSSMYDEELLRLPVHDLKVDKFNINSGAIQFTIDPQGYATLFLGVPDFTTDQDEPEDLPNIQYVNGGGLELLLNPCGVTIGASDGTHFDVTFEHHPERFAPVPANSLAGAILRNLAYAEGEARLDVQLENECRRMADLMQAIMKDEELSYRKGIGRLSADSEKEVEEGGLGPGTA